MSHIDPRYCRDFLHGSCDRVNCRYEHATAAELMNRGEDVGRMIFCRDFQRSNCFRPSGTCRFIHATTRDEQYYRTYKMLPPHLQNVPSSIPQALRNPAQAVVPEQYVPGAVYATQVPGMTVFPTIPAAPTALPQTAIQQQPLEAAILPPPPFSPASTVHSGYPLAHAVGLHSQTLLKQPNAPVSSVAPMPHATTLVQPAPAPAPLPPPPPPHQVPMLQVHQIPSYPQVATVPSLPPVHNSSPPMVPRNDTYSHPAVVPTQRLPQQAAVNLSHRSLYVAYQPSRRVYTDQSKYRVKVGVAGATGNGDHASGYVPTAYMPYQYRESHSETTIATTLMPDKAFVSDQSPPTTSSAYSPTEIVPSTSPDGISSVTSTLELLQIGSDSAVTEHALSKDQEIATAALESSTEETCA